MKQPRTTLQAVRAGAVRHRIAPLYERRKVHREVDRIYDDAAQEKAEVVGFALVVLVRAPGQAGARPYTRSVTIDHAAMAGVLGLVRAYHERMLDESLSRNDDWGE